VTNVAWPGRRSDVVNALQILGTARPRELSRWPGLDEAVHWLVDDTWWDHQEPAGDGTILHDDHEAAAITAVLGPLVAILDEIGPDEDDDVYLVHPRWEQVADAARHAHRLLIDEAAS
jgi:hypothetical protein